MIDGTEEPKIPLKFAKLAARYNEFGYNKHSALSCFFFVILFFHFLSKKFLFLFCKVSHGLLV